MKIGLIPINVGPTDAEQVVNLAQKSEEAGLESIWTFEHAIVPVDYQSKYPYSADGKMGVTPETNFIDPLIALSFAAAHTKTIRLGTGVNILPQTNPLLLAKQAASLDLVSGGRFMLGVGIGWLREEFEAMGTPFERRGARFDDYIEAMNKVWSDDVVEHQSDFLQWTGFKSHPRPVQSPFPVVIGGSKGKAFERIAKYGQGWFAPTPAPDALAKMMKPLGEACAAEGRDVATIEITCMWMPAMGLDSLRQFEDLGVGRLVVPLQALGTKNPIEGIEKLGSDVIAKLD
ncbi:MAG: LLM class F420-dependent oxidoreductase [Deltaproteobacteria bacterium]|nr:LLM class F420-dependent oxidoreductase [Deltaproteobacteria bacterium]MBW2445690.1 LLM class F420-dependent oxidoreductase [Deltaproteobacteria bacterium]